MWSKQNWLRGWQGLLIIGALLALSCGRKEARLTFVLCPKSLNNPYWYAAEDGMKAAAQKYQVNALFLAPPLADVAAQVSLIESLISKRVDGLAISPNDPDGIKSVIDRTIDTGIPTITFDSDAPQSKRICYIGTDNYSAGRKAGEQIVTLLKGKGKVAIITGGLGALNLNQRIAGFRDELKESGAAIEQVSIQACDDNTDIALNKMEDVTRSLPDLNAWFITGCWATVAPKNAFLTAIGNRRDMVVVGFDTLPEQLQLVKEGIVQVLIGQRPYDMGFKSIEVLYDIVVSKKMPASQFIDTGVDVVTAENVTQFLVK